MTGISGDRLTFELYMVRIAGIIAALFLHANLYRPHRSKLKSKPLEFPTPYSLSTIRTAIFRTVGMLPLVANSRRRTRTSSLRLGGSAARMRPTLLYWLCAHSGCDPTLPALVEVTVPLSIFDDVVFQFERCWTSTFILGREWEEGEEVESASTSM